MSLLSLHYTLNSSCVLSNTEVSRSTVEMPVLPPWPGRDPATVFVDWIRTLSLAEQQRFFQLVGKSDYYENEP